MDWQIVIFYSVGVALSVIDIKWYRLPDILTIPLLGLGLILAGFHGQLLNHFLAAALGIALFWAIAALGQRLYGTEAMGGGDIKLAGAIAAYWGMIHFFNTVCYAFFLAAVLGIFLLIFGKKQVSERLPFGPFLILGSAFSHGFSIHFWFF